MIIDEDGDGVRFTRWRRGPAPAQTTPKLSRGEGLLAAAKAVPRVMATDIYRSWMPPDLAAIELKQFDLCVTVPNWILDPKRYSLASKSPTERRLCWRAAYLLNRQDTIGAKESRPVHQFTPGIPVYFRGCGQRRSGWGQYGAHLQRPRQPEIRQSVTKKSKLPGK